MACAEPIVQLFWVLDKIVKYGFIGGASGRVWLLEVGRGGSQRRARAGYTRVLAQRKGRSYGRVVVGSAGGFARVKRDARSVGRVVGLVGTYTFAFVHL